MDKVKASIKDFTSRSGHHDTTVHETVAPAVQHETVKPHQHEELNTAIDKEVHQDHYHRSVQPVHDREILPEKHSANIGAVQHREFDNRDHEHTKRALAEGQSGFRDQQAVQDTTQSQSVNPAVGGEHVHHHVHETIQPVVHKETVQPNVVHTTVPIHETHHNAAKHHNTSELPPVTMDQFKTKGGVLGGREERYDGFEGEPQNIGGSLLGGKHTKHDSHHTGENVQQHAGHGDYESDPLHRRGDGAGTGAGHGAGALGGAAMSSGNHSGIGSDQAGLGSDRTGLGSDHSGFSSNDRTGAGVGDHSGNIRGVEESRPVGSGTGNGNHPARRLDDQNLGGKKPTSIGGLDAGVGAGTGGISDAHTQKKAGLMDKLNPKIDADGDGKAGFMK